VGKLLLFLLVAIALYVLLSGATRAVVDKVRRWYSRSSYDASDTNSESMVACSYCGTHIPVSEALRLSDKIFCSEEHRRISQTSQP